MEFPYSRAVRGCLMAMLLFSSSAASSVFGEEAKPEKLRVYIGTYNERGSKGIYRCELDLATGELTKPELAGEAKNASFLAIHPSHRFLYAVGEIDNFEGKKGVGGVSAFAIDPKTGDLTLLNQQSSGGAGPCHCVVDKAGKHVLSANYGGGSACVHPIEEDGKLGKMTSFKQHKGSSVNKQRQEAPHAHSINLSLDNQFAFVADLGLDEVVIYKFDGKKGTLTENLPSAAEVKAGSGPRHFAFHPKDKQAFVINELANTLTVLEYNDKNGGLIPAQTLSTLPEDFKGTSYTAEVVVHPSGKFVYGSNRGHNSIAIFARNSQPGSWKFVGTQAKGIKTPRNFNIDPTGKYLIVANQDWDSLIVFKIDQKTGELELTETKVDVPMPVCVRFMPLAK